MASGENSQSFSGFSQRGTRDFIFVTVEGPNFFKTSLVSFSFHLSKYLDNITRENFFQCVREKCNEFDVLIAILLIYVENK